MPLFENQKVENVSSKHPLYNEFRQDWLTVRDAYRGSRVVKGKGEKYLPVTETMYQDGLESGQAGYRAYEAYRKRAHYPDIVKDSVQAMLGVMHQKPPVIELPKVMEPLLKSATLKHESLEMLLRRINEEQLIGGRLGLLLDLPQDPTLDVNSAFYLAMYKAEDVINWAELQTGAGQQAGVSLVVLDETEFEQQEGDYFAWQEVEKYRVLALDGGVYQQGLYRKAGAEAKMLGPIQPGIRGTELKEIPFVFINSKDIDPEPEEPPLLGLAELALTIYRGEADYRQSLFLQSQDTLVIIGGKDDEEYRVGAGNAIKLNAGPQVDAKFIGVTSDGLEEQRQALENDRRQAVRKSGQMLDDTSREKESGDALAIRAGSKTATLNQIVMTGAFGLEWVLKIGAAWIGANPDEVRVQPNLDFINDLMQARELVEYVTAKASGAPISLKTIHGNMYNKGVTELSFEEEQKQIEAEKDAGLWPGDMLDEGEGEGHPEPGPEDE